MPRQLAEKRMAVLCQLPTVWPDPESGMRTPGRARLSAHNRQRSQGRPWHRCPVSRHTRDLGAPWHFLYFLPEPRGQGALRGVFA